jgi:hypothetical protein
VTDEQAGRMIALLERIAARLEQPALAQFQPVVAVPMMAPVQTPVHAEPYRWEPHWGIWTR